ncbi:PTS sugar transporter subunit IIB [Lacticaseibacillus suilingensis]|uniref:PTS sugar transporter subunit IIB n=1 Tax=Lacticaseibacillus suilingensis TaxID=2799577 RepID=A0ABW4BGS0_9LACO|nr:PTS sugar transporter subunit IIB [Lacticaseibacillus suilingensis]
MIKLIRIDDRLIHGQIAMAWTRAVGADDIMVVDDASAKDSMKKMILSLAKPAGVDLHIIASTDFTSTYEPIKSHNIMVVTSSPKYALQIMNDLGDEAPTSLNLGGIRYAEGKERISDAISLTPEDKTNLQSIKDLGIKIVIQATPTSSEKPY